MNELATYTFLPWLRRGVSTGITRVQGSGEAAARARIPVTLTITSDQPRQTNLSLDLHGPGEIAGIDPRMVVRLDPKPGVQDTEPNYFPAVEFHEPDFPWRYTPARAPADQRLRPWLVLVVLSPGDIKAQYAATSDGKLAQLEVASASVLPDLDQSWAWAHAQVSGLEPGESVEDVIERAPHRALSRLLCPINLQPHTPYTGFLVPAFERGRLAGLGLPVPDLPDAVVDSLTPAWTSAQANVLLPVYFKWEFATGAEGDFELLVRKLQARRIKDVGKRAMDVSEPDPELPPAAGRPLEMEGALKALLTEPAPWPTQERLRYLEGDAATPGLAAVLNRPQDLLEGGETEPILAPPLYARWHAKQNRLKPGAPPPWFNTLNEDPRHRSTASLGTRIVQEQQEALMGSAWEQLEDVLAINEKLRQTQFGRELADQARRKYLAPLDDETFIAVTAPVHRRVRTSPETVHALTQQARLAFFGLGTFRRALRLRGAIARRVRRVGAAVRPSSMLARANENEITPAPPPVTPEVLLTRRKVTAGWATPSTTAGQLTALERAGWILFLLALVLVVIALIASPTPVMVGVAVVAAIALVVSGLALRRRSQRLAPVIAFRDGTLTAGQVRSMGAANGFVPLEAEDGANIASDPASGAEDRAGVAAFRTAMADLADSVFTAPPREAAPVPLAIPRVRERLAAGLDARVNHVLAIRERLQVAPWIVWAPRDPLDSVMGAPEFEQPMYEPLRDLSQEWLLPGVGTIPENTTGLLQTNQKFIEAYMAGLNHEMARELMWREYPTDLRGTCFRQFWDVRGYLDTGPNARDREALLDIKRLHQWQQSALGENTARTPPPGGAYLVLLVKGEVMKRYPTTRVYAVQAVVGNDGKLTLGPTESHPTFGGTLEPDMAFFGFELTLEAVRGRLDSDTDLGWFFVLQQQPTEPRFGLDAADPTTVGAPVGPTWDDLSFGNLVDSSEDLLQLRHIDLTAARPDTQFTDTSQAAWHQAAGTDAAQLAYITLQKPFRVALHGSAMVPEGTP